jgi:molybdenum cofactor biosynthesis enzyme MoaA
MSFDFANILFGGPCNLRCPYCIGRQVEPALTHNNLNRFPLRNLARFTDLIKFHRVSQVVFTGTTTDPLLYRHQVRLLIWLREALPPYPLTNGSTQPVCYSLHTNGRLALPQLETFNLYDRVCISFPSFRPDTYARMTGSIHVPDLAEIVRQARAPVKVSCIITDDNAGEIDEFLERCLDIGIKRLVFRQPYGDTRRSNILAHLPQICTYRRNPVYDYHGLEVTCWNFHQTTSASLNLFSDGTISADYLLAPTKNRNVSTQPAKCW